MLVRFFINIIIDSLTERTECFADKYTYAVGSMLTFLAELAAWAKNLKIDDLGNTQQEVQQRIQYLDAIMVQIVKNDLFKEPKTSYRMEILVDKLRKYLGETVLVRVQREISSQSSRDHFKNVRVYLTNFLQVKDIFEKIFSKVLRMPDVIYDDWKINYMEARVQFFELKNALELSGKTINIIASEMQRFLSHKKAVQEEVVFLGEGHFPLPLMKHPLLQLLPLLGQVKVVIPQYLTIYLELCNFLEFGTCLVCAVNCYFTHVLLN